MLASGRRYELTAGAEADRVTIRSRTGEVVLRIEVTDAGPVLSFSGASVELVAARSLRLAAEDVFIEAGKAPLGDRRRLTARARGRRPSPERRGG